MEACHSTISSSRSGSGAHDYKLPSPGLPACCAAASTRPALPENALVVFADGVCFELIAAACAARAERWWQQLQQHGEAWSTLRCGPRDRRRGGGDGTLGLDMKRLMRGGLRPDGEQLRWRENAFAPARICRFWYATRPDAARLAPGCQARPACIPMARPALARLEVAVQDLRRASLARWRGALRGDGVRRRRAAGLGTTAAREAGIAGSPGTRRAGAGGATSGRGALLAQDCCHSRRRTTHARIVLSVPQRAVAEGLDEVATHGCAVNWRTAHSGSRAGNRRRLGQ